MHTSSSYPAVYIARYLSNLLYQSQIPPNPPLTMSLSEHQQNIIQRFQYIRSKLNEAYTCTDINAMKGKILECDGAAQYGLVDAKSADAIAKKISISIEQGFPAMMGKAFAIANELNTAIDGKTKTIEVHPSKSQKQQKYIKNVPMTMPMVSTGNTNQSIPPSLPRVSPTQNVPSFFVPPPPLPPRIPTPPATAVLLPASMPTVLPASMPTVLPPTTPASLPLVTPSATVTKSMPNNTVVVKSVSPVLDTSLLAQTKAQLKKTNSSVLLAQAPAPATIQQPVIAPVIAPAPVITPVPAPATIQQPAPATIQQPAPVIAPATIQQPVIAPAPAPAKSIYDSYFDL